MKYLTDLKALFVKMDPHTLILTPNQRLSRYLLEKWDEENQKNKAAWVTPAILAFDRFLINAFQQLTDRSDLPRLLSSLEEQTLWQNLLKDDEKFSRSDLFGLTQQFMEAWRFMHLWEISFSALTDFPQEDYQWFLKIALQFQSLLASQRYITHAELSRYLLTPQPFPVKQVAFGKIGDFAHKKEQKSLQTELNWCPWKKIIFFAFDEITPSLNTFIHQLSLYSIEIEQLEQQITGEAITAYGFTTTEKEITAMARWAKEAYQQGCQSIACVVPELNRHRKKIVRIFQQVFYPHELFQTPRLKAMFTITGGEPLSETPLIQCALSLLTALLTTFNVENLHLLFQTPYLLGGMHEQYVRNLLLAKMREKIFTTVTLTEIERHLLRENTCTDMLKIIHILLRFQKEAKGKKQLNTWIMYLTALLREVSWPGERVLNSIEYQQIKKFDDTLRELAILDAITLPLDYVDFVAWLRNHLHKQLFQSQTLHAPIQILGTLEAAGQTFEKIWMMDLSLLNWPEAPRPNPFIPLSIQKQYELPHSSAEKELQFSEKMQNRFIHSAKEVVFSYASENEEGHQLPSNLITAYLSLAEMKVDNVNVRDLFLQEPLLQVTAPHIPLSLAYFKADSALLKKQVECPFQAFAHYRLKVKPLEKIYFKTNKRIRGTLLHQVLQTFWEQHQPIVILSMDEESLKQTCFEHVSHIVKIFYHERGTVDHYFIALEIQRMSSLLEKWLSHERLRLPFTIVEIEKKHTLRINQVEFNIRIDRVDALESGDFLLIDYKTGMISIREWLQEDFTAPQLPLYCLLFPEKIAGVVFAKVAPEEMAFKGIAIHHSLLPGMDKQREFSSLINAFIEAQLGLSDSIASSKTLTMPEFKTLIESWDAKIKKIAGDFIAGNLTVNPINETICNYCQRQTLCRIYEKQDKNTC